jgi:hypothetical protein
MRSRTSMPPQLRQARTRLHLLLNQGGFLKGSLVRMRNTCGKKNCKCARGELHESLYFSRSVNGRQKMTLIPRHLRAEVQDMAGRYKKISETLEKISDLEWQRIEEAKMNK